MQFPVLTYKCVVIILQYTAKYQSEKEKRTNFPVVHGNIQCLLLAFFISFKNFHVKFGTYSLSSWKLVLKPEHQ